MISKIKDLISDGLFGLAAFAITYTGIFYAYVSIFHLIDFNIYTPQGEIEYKYFNQIYFIIIGLLLGMVATYYREKNRWLKKLSPLIYILFLPFTWIIGLSTNYKMRELEHTSKRIQILRSIHGNKIEPCDVLKIGDQKSRVHELYEKFQLDSPNELTTTKSGRMVNSVDFQLPFQAPYFSVYFDPKDETILEIECFNGKRKKSKGAEPDTVYDYIEE